jgi:LmbE family N-acetylglucosaminyl deacetylase
MKRPGFQKFYFIIATILLFATTIYWSVLAADIHRYNADQLIDPLLFDHAQTISQAVLPGQHTFLFKWPLFLLVQLLGSSALAFSVITVLVSVATVGLLALVLYKIERRPLLIGTIFLALASILLMVPAESYPGALLPVNMAMLATRNLEYILYIVSLLFMIRAPRLVSWRSGTAVVMLSILIASDKLFLSLSLGGALIGLVMYWLLKRHSLLQLALRWLVVTVAAGGLAFSFIALLSASHIVTIDNSSGLSPYNFTKTLKDFILGSIYAVASLLTNLGANPVSDIVIPKDFPGQLLHRFLSFSMVAFLINITLAVFGAIASYHIIGRSLRATPPAAHHAKKKTPPVVSRDTPYLLSLTLILTTLTALVIFIASSHYYAVDARYEGIAIFAACITGATYLRRMALKPILLVSCGAILLLSIGIGTVHTLSVHDQSIAAYQKTDANNSLIAAALNQHHVTSLIGDYWRVTPIKLQLDDTTTIVPLSDCTTLRQVLTNKAWQQNATKHSFAYILTTDSTATGYPGCTINQVVSTYGRPSATQLIAGTADDPDETLLFYDHGATAQIALPHHATASVLPHSIGPNSDVACNSQTILMNIVAHQDDDILFMNPDLYHQLQAGACVRSVYLTAGDAGGGQLYWLGREEGSKAAYASMLGIKDPQWVSRTVKLSNTSYVTIAKLKNNTQVTLVFLHLPDGNIDGQGFKATKFESLVKLKTGAISHIHGVGGQSTYTSSELIQTLLQLMEAFRPTEINTQALKNLSSKFPDHSDHIATAQYAQAAYEQFSSQYSAVPFKSYVGYPIRDQQPNINAADLLAKETAFFNYSQHDKGTCESIVTCEKMSYIFYLKRQYQATDPTVQWH